MNIVSKFAVEKNTQYQSDEGFRNNINFILTFLSVIIFGLFAIRPSITTITGLIKDIDEYRRVNGILIEKISILNEVKANPGKLNQESNLISQALPPTPDEGGYIRNIDFTASKNQVQIESVNFTVPEQEGVETLNFTLTVSGKYSQVVSFIADFNKLLRITSIESIDISPQEKDLSTVKASVTGKAYYLTEPVLLGANND